MMGTSGLGHIPPPASRSTCCFNWGENRSCSRKWELKKKKKKREKGNLSKAWSNLTNPAETIAQEEKPVPTHKVE